MPRVAGHFCWIYFFPARKKRAAVKSSSLNLNVAHQNFEAKKFLNPQHQNVRLFAGSHAAQLHISCVLLLQPPAH